MTKLKDSGVKPTSYSHKPFVHPNAFSIYVDGSFRPPDNASCAYVIFSERTKHIVKLNRFAFRGMTINQMELMAVNKALDHPKIEHAVIYSDSSYTISALTLWHKAWAKNNWTKQDGTPVVNKDLICEILEKIKRLKFCRFVKVSAHTGDPFNSLADYMAVTLSGKMMQDPTITQGEYPM